MVAEYTAVSFCWTTNPGTYS